MVVWFQLYKQVIVKLQRYIYYTVGQITSHRCNMRYWCLSPCLGTSYYTRFRACAHWTTLQLMFKTTAWWLSNLLLSLQHFLFLPFFGTSVCSPERKYRCKCKLAYREVEKVMHAVLQSTSYNIVLVILWCLFLQ